MEGELTKEEYLEMRGKVEEEKKRAGQRLADFEKQVEDRTNLLVTQEEGRELLTSMIKSGAEFVEDRNVRNFHVVEFFNAYHKQPNHRGNFTEESFEMFEFMKRMKNDKNDKA